MASTRRRTPQLYQIFVVNNFVIINIALQKFATIRYIGNNKADEHMYHTCSIIHGTKFSRVS